MGQGGLTGCALMPDPRRQNATCGGPRSTDRTHAQAPLPPHNTATTTIPLLRRCRSPLASPPTPPVAGAAPTGAQLSPDRSPPVWRTATLHRQQRDPVAGCSRSALSTTVFGTLPAVAAAATAAGRPTPTPQPKTAATSSNGYDGRHGWAARCCRCRTCGWYPASPSEVTGSGAAANAVQQVQQGTSRGTPGPP